MGGLAALLLVLAPLSGGRARHERVLEPLRSTGDTTVTGKTGACHLLQAAEDTG